MKEQNHTEMVHVSTHMLNLEKKLDSETKASLMQKITEISETLRSISEELSSNDRRQFVGKGFRNLGFMAAANNSANNNPEFMPLFVNINEFNEVEDDFLFMRNMVERLNAITADASVSMNIFGNESYNMAVAYYVNVKQVAKRTNNSQAQSVFNTLRKFFRRGSYNSSHPTEKELKSDIHALLHGKKDGRILIENERPHTIGGRHEVVDEIIDN